MCQHDRHAQCCLRQASVHRALYVMQVKTEQVGHSSSEGKDTKAKSQKAKQKQASLPMYIALFVAHTYALLLACLSWQMAVVSCT